MIQLTIQDDILIGNYTPDMRLNIETAKKLVAMRLLYQNGRDYPVIIHINGLLPDSKEVRIYMATTGIKGITQGAFVAKNIYENVLLQFFLSVDKPNVPSKVFAKEEEAVQWIKEETNN